MGYTDSLHCNAWPAIGPKNGATNCMNCCNCIWSCCGAGVTVAVAINSVDLGAGPAAVVPNDLKNGTNDSEFRGVCNVML